jgi:hypothetical protein
MHRGRWTNTEQVLQQKESAINDIYTKAVAKVTAEQAGL